MAASYAGDARGAAAVGNEAQPQPATGVSPASADGPSPFSIALEDLDTPKVRSMLQFDPLAYKKVNAKVDGKQGNGLPLQEVIRNGGGENGEAAMELVQCLLDFGANPALDDADKELDDEGQGSALHVAAGMVAHPATR
eukprot:6436231-Prymnesium_polylepis.1